mmetsp:Transcript_30501/g.97400  ORF Transcript_30501/g.97400 Transcript_30501/m.97400 type:complete len:200 (+) Transcript_30501:961-1560(+)
MHWGVPKASSKSCWSNPSHTTSMMVEVSLRGKAPERACPGNVAAPRAALRTSALLMCGDEALTTTKFTSPGMLSCIPILKDLSVTSLISNFTISGAVGSGTTIGTDRVPMTTCAGSAARSKVVTGLPSGMVSEGFPSCPGTKTFSSRGMCTSSFRRRSAAITRVYSTPSSRIPAGTKDVYWSLMLASSGTRSVPSATNG